MVFVVIAVVVLMVFGACRFVAEGARAREEGDRLFWKWYEEHKESGDSDSKAN